MNQLSQPKSAQKLGLRLFDWENDEPALTTDKCTKETNSRYKTKTKKKEQLLGSRLVKMASPTELDSQQ